MKCALLVLLFVGFSAVKSEEDLLRGVDVDEDDSLKLEDDGTFWGKLTSSRFGNGHRSIQSDSDRNSNDRQDGSKMSLKEFLETFTKNYNKQHTSPYNSEPGVIGDSVDVAKSKDKASKWTLLDLQRHNHPYDDRKGWVSLDPVPWSVSKISKWESKYKPVSERPWDDDYGSGSSHRPSSYHHNDELEFNRPVSVTPPSPYVYHRPAESSDRYDTYYDSNRLRPTPSPSSYPPRPTAYFGHKVHVETHFPSDAYGSASSSKPYAHHSIQDCKHPHHPYDDIITDGRPANFPPPGQYDSFRRRGSEIEIHSDNHPLNGEGEWVLLSTTKGYKPPRAGKRSLSLGSTSEPTQTLRASRGVRLTVLPPLKGSNVNMTTSHGGLLQVESTFESVEQAKQKFDKKQNVLKIKGKRKRRKPGKKNGNETGESSQRVDSGPQYGDPGAVMAAVGAGMIPATMAMMVPIAMSG